MPVAGHGSGNVQGIVFNIQRYSIHDGPGIRTTVFLKGCPLRCFWCQNPESQSVRPEIRFNKEDCTRCGACVAKCPMSANRIGEESAVIDRTKCIGCGACVDACRANARKLEGQRMTVDEVMAVVLKDKKAYARSGGGMTLSGGDPVMQPEFSLALLKAAKEHGLHTAIETCGHTKWEILEKLLRHTDYLFFDNKSMDPEQHRRGTGHDNRLILENARRAARTVPEMHVRSPMIPTFNDMPESVAAIARHVTGEMGLPAENFTILRYNKYAEGKYEQLGREEERVHFEPQPPEIMEELNSIIRSFRHPG